MKKFNVSLRYFLSVSLLLLAGCSSYNFDSFRWDDTGKNNYNASDNSTAESNQIALLLPLSGAMGGPGRAVRDGFMASYYEALQSGQTDAKVRTYDTNTGNIDYLYKRAISEGADCVVGPLDKDRVQQIMRSPVPVTTIVLNYPTIPQASSSKVYQFGLSPLDEAKATAEFAYNQGHHSALIIAPAGAWGNGVVEAFRAQWKQLGGHVARQYTYLPNQDMGPYIRQALQVSDDKAHEKRLSEALGRPLRAEEHRRQDIDMIFLVALPPKARQINPLLKFYYAADLPVYSISTVYSGVPAPLYDQDLDGIQFDDVPWIFNLEALTLSHFPRLYALGMDAFTIVLNRAEWRNSPNYGISGKTGTLYLTQGNRIVRRDLAWAQFQSGEVVTIQ